ncbi:hypothetical protein [Bacillus sp. AM 13(2015)]|uniref:hypothetical protein n=1 Tax=Bacillus sp. AM 13(2015) TaxID=1739115 RepID=UPI000AFB49E9|nr:hypothetical protein [Bacillus sp. AM 13(2015)]
MTMKKGLTISLLIFSLIVSLFAPVGSADAKQAKKAKVSTHYYKKEKNVQICTGEKPKQGAYENHQS